MWFDTVSQVQICEGWRRGEGFAVGAHLPLWVLGISWVQKDSSVHERPVDVRHHGADVARSVRLTAVLQRFKNDNVREVFGGAGWCECRSPQGTSSSVGTRWRPAQSPWRSLHSGCKCCPAFWSSRRAPPGWTRRSPDVEIKQNEKMETLQQTGTERTDRVQHEAVDSLAGGENDHGGAAVQGVTRRHQVPARLQSVFLTRLVVCGLQNRAGNVWLPEILLEGRLVSQSTPNDESAVWYGWSEASSTETRPFHPESYLPVNAEDRSNRHQTVDVGGSIQRIEADDVFTLKKKVPAEIQRIWLQRPGLAQFCCFIKNIIVLHV